MITLRDLVLKMPADERLMVKAPNILNWLDCTPDEIINEWDILTDYEISTIQRSPLYNAIMIELDY